MKQISRSLPESPDHNSTALHPPKTWRNAVSARSTWTSLSPPRVAPATCLDSLNLPYVDESLPATPVLDAKPASGFQRDEVDSVYSDKSTMSSELLETPKTTNLLSPSRMSRAQRLCSIAITPTIPVVSHTNSKRYSVGTGLAVTGYRCSVIVGGPVAIQPVPVIVGGPTPSTVGGGTVTSRRCEPTHFHWTSTGATLPRQALPAKDEQVDSLSSRKGD